MAKPTWGDLVSWNNEMTAACNALLSNCGPFSPTWKQCETMVGGRRCCGWVKLDEKGSSLFADVAVYRTQAEVEAYWAGEAAYSSHNTEVPRG